MGRHEEVRTACQGAAVTAVAGLLFVCVECFQFYRAASRMHGRRCLCGGELKEVRE